MNHIITVIEDDGTSTEYEVITMFQNRVTKREIIVFSDNKLDENGLITVQLSSLDRTTDPPSLDDISDEEMEEITALIDQLLKEPDSANSFYATSIQASTRESITRIIWELLETD